jgi:CRISPR-associated protein Cas8a1/Csx13
MAMKALRNNASATPPLVIGLTDPAMTPLLRCGLGGLAASLRAALVEQSPRKAKWPNVVTIGGADYTVGPRTITVDWKGVAPEKALEKLFEHAFRLTKQGIIDLPGTYQVATPPTPELRAALQRALKKTFLQHGKTTTKNGAAKSISFVLDDKPIATSVQPYSAFAHQGAWAVVTKGLSKPVELAGWAYPGATQRHVAFGDTKYEYSAATALCALFALIGSVSLEAPRGAPGGAGILVLVEPTDLVQFATKRPFLSPSNVADVYVGGAGDAALQIQAALRAGEAEETGGRSVRATHATLLKATPWASQQKSRSAAVSVADFDGIGLKTYATLSNKLPSKLRPTKAPAKGKNDDEAGYFAVASALRAFVAENLARRRRWYAGFAAATTAERQPRYIHYYWDRDGLGALRFEERKGLIAMTESLNEAESVLVSSVQQALRQRFGRIWDESKESSLQTRRNRMDGERERLRLAFAGSKTPEQIRAALADLWSRAGTVRELQEGWKLVLPLLRPENWQTARDLALVALASYQGRGAVEGEGQVSEEEANE